MATVKFQAHADGAALVRKTHHHTYVVKTHATGRVVFAEDGRRVPVFPRTKATRELMKAQSVLGKFVAQYAAAVAIGNQRRAQELPFDIEHQLDTL